MHNKEKYMEMLKKHRKHHTSKHMKVMKALINRGMSFDKAHKTAMKQVGK
jgi:hypothetical protein|tara:strand:- start:549 stop:698 length:150 start_codon:yes stop_codon:yes gene_type:complete